MAVAPCEGAWIEISKDDYKYYIRIVAPCEGAWIEILIPYSFSYISANVAPCEGTWIEVDGIKNQLKSIVGYAL